MHYTIIPLKILVNSKKRLEAFLNPSERRELVLALLKDVLRAATGSQSTDKVLLVTPDSLIIETTQKWGYPKLEFLLEPEERGINQAVQFALEWCLSKSVSSILIIPADIPLITSKLVDKFLNLGMTQYPLIISPSIRKDGTNAFYQRPPNLIKVWYGPDSFQKNLKSISEQDIPYKIFEDPSFALDIDLKEDLRTLQESKIDCHSVKYANSLKF